jgi:hypothetical protein
MNFRYSVRRVFVVVIAIGFLQGCNNDSNPIPDQDAKSIVAPLPPKKIQDIQKKKGRLIPKSIKDRE